MADLGARFSFGRDLGAATTAVEPLQVTFRCRTGEFVTMEVINCQKGTPPDFSGFPNKCSNSASGVELAVSMSPSRSRMVISPRVEEGRVRGTRPLQSPLWVRDRGLEPFAVTSKLQSGNSLIQNILHAALVGFGIVEIGLGCAAGACRGSIAAGCVSRVC
jgi:hypothetical protein